MYKINWARFVKEDTFRTSEGNVKRSSSEYDKRTAFESDFGRVVFSTASRRMHDKTQVIPLTTNDNVHSRLTHSLEVMNIGYSLGIGLCRNEEFIGTYGIEIANDLAWKISIILKTAGLVHDIGNPPFGHFGEEIIQEYFKKFFANNSFYNISDEEKYDYIHFDGNAQGFRVLTKLQYLNDLYGLNLTKTTLASYLKYPNSSKLNEEKDEQDNYKFIALKKHGVFTTEKKYLDDIISTFSLSHSSVNFRHPLSFLVEAADSICYLIMDIEDGYGKDWFSFSSLKEVLSENEKIKKLFDKIEGNITKKGLKLEDIPDRKLMVDFRVSVIDYFVELAIKNFILNAEKIENGKYNYELINDDPNKVSTTLYDFCKKNIFPQREIVSLELCGDSVLTGLLDIYINLAFHENSRYREKARNMISKAILRTAIKETDNSIPIETEDIKKFDLKNLSDNARLRMIVDFISGMTDQFAVTHFQLLSGQRI